MTTSITTDLETSEARLWYVARTQSGREAMAAAELAKQGFSVFLPRYRKRVRHARRTRDVERALFPGYIFVGTGRSNSLSWRWRCVNGTLGVIGLLMMGEKPAAVADGFVDRLLAARDANGCVSLPPRLALKPGDRVRICDSAFDDTLALIDEMKDHDRVVVLLSLLGRNVRVSVDRWLVDHA